MKVSWTWAVFWSVVLAGAIGAGFYWASGGCFYLRDSRNYVFPPLLVVFFVFFLMSDNNRKFLVLITTAVVVLLSTYALQERNANAVIETRAVQQLRELRNRAVTNRPMSKYVLREDANYTFTYDPAGERFSIEATPRAGCCFVLRAFTIDSDGNIYWAWPTRAASIADSRL